MADSRFTLWAYKRYAAERLNSIYPAREADSLAMRMLEEVVNAGQDKLLACWQDELTDSHKKRLNKMLNRLLEGVPLQYITGYAWFDGLRFKVTPHTLIPRPETEFLVEEVVSRISRYKRETKILDLGTGSGCIAVAVKKRMPVVHMHASDICCNALEVAKENALYHRTAIGFMCDNMLSPSLKKYHRDGYDLIVSNPPYIPRSEKALMHQNVVDHEPDGALFVPDQEPLVFYRAIMALAGQLLAPEGAVILEIHENKAPEIKSMCKNMGYKKICQINDLADKPRVLVVSSG